MLVVHSNPLHEPGLGDAGGMTVYVRQVAAALAARGVAVDVYARADLEDLPPEAMLAPGVTVIPVRAGPPWLPKEDLPAHLPEFAAKVAESAAARGLFYDVIHSHYWLSGRVAAVLSRRWGIPFLHTFHTLARVKNERLRRGDVAEPEGRLIGEARVIGEADGIVASTPQEREWLLDLYAAHPERIHLVPPGVDHRMFSPGEGDREAARAGLVPAGAHLVLFVGRLQPLKGADTAVRAVAHLVDWGRIDPGGIRLLVVGGSSGPVGEDEPERLRALARSLGVGEVVRLLGPRPHAELPALYRAADVCLVPSHAESFGLVALEAQACGVPVVGSAVGGLRSIVRHGQTGFLVEPGASAAFAERTWRILSDPALAAAMGRLGACSSGDFSWERCAAELHGLYEATGRNRAGERLVPLLSKKVLESRRNL